MAVMFDPLLAGERIAVFARHPDGRCWGDWYAPTARAVHELGRLNDDGFDIYWHLNNSNHTLPAVRASRQTVTVWRSVLVDLDRLTDESLDERDLRDFDAGPTVIHSGRGWQLIYHLLEPVVVTEVNARHIEVATKNFLCALSENHVSPRFKVDLTTYDLARIARLPPFKNTKNGQRAFILRKGEKTLDSAEVMRYCPVLPVVEPLTPVAVPENIDRPWLLTHLSLTGARFIFEGASYPNRHHSCFVAVRDLLDLGVHRHDCLAIALAAAPCQPPLPPREVTQIVNNAYRGV